MGGLLYLAGAVIGFVNLYRTWKGRPAAYAEPVHEAPPLARDFALEAKPASNLDDVVPVAKRLDVWGTLWWHRKWERLPMRFTFFTVVAVLIASAFELVPTFVIRSNVPTIASVTPYTPLELAGRDIYVAEGCYNCHSQMIRPIISETKRYGDYSKPGESVYDHPHQWGSRRIGPDLAREGGVRSHSWHVTHFENPRNLSYGSIMPPYPWLMRKEIDFPSIPLRMQANRAVGVPYEDAEIASAVGHAEAQAAEIHDEFLLQNQGPYVNPEGEVVDLSDKKVIALIAYLQRLGVDLTRPTPTPAADAEGEGESGAGGPVASVRASAGGAG